MKKMFFVIAITIIAVFCSYGQHKNKKYHITVDNFEGNKPLENNCDVWVYFTEDREDGYLFPAYKGETEKSFLLRLRNDSIKNVKENSFESDSSFKQSFRKSEVPFEAKPKKEPSNDKIVFAIFVIVSGVIFISYFKPKNT